MPFLMQMWENKFACPSDFWIFFFFFFFDRWLSFNYFKIRLNYIDYYARIKILDLLIIVEKTIFQIPSNFFFFFSLFYIFLHRKIYQSHVNE